MLTTHLLEKETDLRYMQELLDTAQVKQPKFTHMYQKELSTIMNPLDELYNDTT